MANPVQGPVAAAPVVAPAVNFNNRYQKLEITKAYLSAISSAECSIESLAAKITILAFPVIAAVTLIMDAINYMFDSSNKNAAIKEARAQFAAANPEEAARRAGAKKEEVDFGDINFDALPLEPLDFAEAKPANPGAVILVNPEGVAHAEVPVAFAAAIPLPEVDDLAEEAEEQQAAPAPVEQAAPAPVEQAAVLEAEEALPGKVILAPVVGDGIVVEANKLAETVEKLDRREARVEKIAKKAKKAKAAEARAAAVAKKLATDELKAAAAK